MIPSTITQRQRAMDVIQHPISKVEYFPSPYGVPSYGMQVSWQGVSKTTLSPTGSIYFVGNDRIINHNVGDGSAFGFSNVDYFRINWSGYLFVQTSGVYSVIINKDITSSGSLLLNTQTYTALPGEESKLVTGIALNSGWFPINYTYTEFNEESFTSVLFKPPGSNYYRPFSAGVINTTTGFVQPILLESVTEVNGNYGIGKSSIFTIKVPLSKNPVTSIQSSGSNIIYFYNKDSHSYTMRKVITASNGAKTYLDTNLQQGRLIRIYGGYQTKCVFASGLCTNPNINITGFYNATKCEKYGLPGCPGNLVPTGDYIQHFDGVITNFDVERSHVDDTLEIRCQDYIVYLQENIDKNYPDVLSYLNTALHIDPPSGVDFIPTVFKNAYSRPKAYDSWPVGFVIRDILTKAGIDPSKLFGTREIIQYISPDVSIGYTFQYIQPEIDYVNLTRNPQFGNTIIPGQLNKDDDKYIWTANFGDKLDDLIKRIVDAYGYYLGCKNDGNIEVKRFIDDGTSEFGTGVKFYTGKALAGFYTVSTGEKLSATVTGSSINIKTAISPSSSIFISSYRIPVSAPPDVKPTKWNNNFPLNIFYGAFNSPNSTGAWNRVSYTSSRFAASPSGLSVSGIKFSLSADTTRGGYPSSGGPRIDYCTGLRCDIYFGPTSYTAGGLPSITGVAANKVKSNYKVPDLGLVDFNYANYFVDIDFDKKVFCTGGLYVLEIVASGNKEIIPTGIGNGRYIGINSFTYNGTTNNYPYYTLVVSGLSSIAFTGYTDSMILGASNRVYNDIEFREAYPPSMPKTMVEVYTGSVIIFSGSYRQYNPTGTLFFQGGRNVYNDYPQLIQVQPWNLVASSTSGGSIDSYNSYAVKIYNSQPSAVTLLEGITAFDDTTGQAWYFDTTENILSLGIKTNYDNIRNDVTVVGNLKSLETDIFTSQIMNKNNPSYIYTYSRAIDIDSIYNLNNPDNIGRQRDFIIFEPGIKTQYHADWLAKGALIKYRRNKNEAQIKSLAVPFLEPFDLAYIVDSKIGSTDLDRIQLVDSIDVTMARGSYTMDINCNPYKPWPSFEKSLLPNVTGNDDSFTNILLTKTNGQNVQVSGLIPPAVTGTYNCYESERTGDARTLVRVQYSQNKSGFTTIKVLDGITKKPIAYLVGTVDGGKEIPEYRDVDPNAELFWNGIDEFGISKIKPSISSDPLITGFVVAPESPGFFAFPGRYYIQFDVEDSIVSSQKYRVITDSLNPLFNPEASGLVATGSNGRIQHGIDIRWSEMGDAQLIIKDVRASVVANHSIYDDYSPTKLSSLVARLFDASNSNFRSSGSFIEPYPDVQYPLINCMFFRDDENGGNGIKFKLYFDETTQDPYRVYTISASLKHVIHAGIFVRSVGLSVNNDIARNAGLDPAMVGCMYSAWKNADLRNYTDLSAEECDIIYRKYFRDDYAFANKSISYLTFDRMDSVGYRSIANQPESASTYSAFQKSTPIKYGDPSNSNDSEGLQNFFYGTPMLDRDMFEMNSTGTSVASTELWSDKFLFSRTPVEVIDDPDFLAAQKIKVYSGGPFVEFQYSPRALKNGALDFYSLPQFTDYTSEETFKQTLREAFNIAKWYNGLDKYGYPGCLVWNKGGSFSLDQIAQTTNMVNWRKYLGDVEYNSITTDPLYWRNDPDIAQYIGIGLVHVVEFQIEVFDNSGRGVKGIKQPARVFVNSTGANANNIEDWNLVFSGGPVSGSGPALMGYDPFNHKNVFLFHSYWIPESPESNAELTRLSLTKYTPHNQIKLRRFPSKLQQTSVGAQWSQPMKINFLDQKTIYAQGAGDLSRPFQFPLFPGQALNINQKESFVLYNESWGHGCANGFGALRGQEFHHRDEDGREASDSIPNVNEFIIDPGLMDVGLYGYSPCVEKITSTVRFRTIAEGIGYNQGPPWYLFSLLSGFKISDIDTLRGIPQRGVRKN